jgi:RNA polymerase sigma factor (sigma-70 family)
LTDLRTDDWVRRLTVGAEGYEQAVAELREYLLRGVSRGLANRYGGQVPIEDIVQESLVKILQNLDSYAGRSQFTTWATAIAIRVGISKLRRHYYREISLDQVLRDGDFRIDLADPARLDAANESERSQLLGLLETQIREALTDRQRLAIRGVLAGLPIEEIASRLGSNRNAIYKLVHDAKTRLRNALEDHGVRAEDLQAIIS